MKTILLTILAIPAVFIAFDLLRWGWHAIHTVELPKDMDEQAL